MKGIALYILAAIAALLALICANVAIGLLFLLLSIILECGQEFFVHFIPKSSVSIACISENMILAFVQKRVLQNHQYIKKLH